MTRFNLGLAFFALEDALRETAARIADARAREICLECAIFVATALNPGCFDVRRTGIFNEYYTQRPYFFVVLFVNIQHRMSSRLTLPRGTKFRSQEGYDVITIDPQFAGLWAPEFDVQTREISPLTDPYLVEHPIVQQFMWSDEYELETSYITRRVVPVVHDMPAPTGAGRLSEAKVEEDDEGSVDLLGGEGLPSPTGSALEANEDLSQLYAEWEWEDANLQLPPGGGGI